MQKQSLYRLQDNSTSQIISIQISSKQFNIPFVQLFKYSQLFQEEYLHSIPLAETIEKLEQILQSNKLQESSISTFIKLLSDEEVDIQNGQYFDLYKLSIIFKVQSLKKLLHQYAEHNSNDVDFILKLIIDSRTKENGDYDDLSIIGSEISIDLEGILKNKINECLVNDQFSMLPISFVYRIIEQSKMKLEIKSDLLYDFVVKSIEERYLLFRFIDLQKLSDDRFDRLCIECEEKNQNGNSYFYGFFPDQLLYIKALKGKVKSVQEECEKKCEMFQVQLDEVNKEIEGYKERLSDAEQKNKELESLVKQMTDTNSKEKKEYENKCSAFRMHEEELNKEIEEFKEKVSEIEQKKNALEQKVAEVNNENGILKDKIYITEKKNEEKQREIDQLKAENQKIEQKQENFGGKQIQFSGNNEFKGIIYYLKSLSSNIDDLLNITASSVYFRYYPKNVIQYENSNEFFGSDNIENSWICFEFKSFYIIPKNYTIKSYPCGKNYCHPKSWVIEGLNDNGDWEQLDQQQNTDVLNGSNIIHTFPILNSKNTKFKFIRMRQTDINWDHRDCAKNHFVLNNIEFYGNLI